MVLHTPKWGKHQWNRSSPDFWDPCNLRGVTSLWMPGSAVWPVCWLYSRAPLVVLVVLGTFCKQRMISPLGLKMLIYPHLCPQAGCLLQQPRTLQQGITKSQQGQGTVPLSSLCLCLMPAWLSLVCVFLCSPGPTIICCPASSPLFGADQEHPRTSGPVGIDFSG